MRNRLLATSGLVSLCCLLGTAAPAQSPAAAPRGSSESCGAVRVDTLRGIAYGNLHVGVEGRAVPRAYLDRVLAGISGSIPDTISLRPTYELPGIVVAVYTSPTNELPPPRSFIQPFWAGHPGLATEVAFTILRSGALADALPLVAGDSAVVSRLLRAIADANDLRGGESLPEGVPGDGVPVVLRLSARADPTAAASQPLFAIAQPRPQETAAKPNGPLDPSPRFPLSEARVGTQAHVVVWLDVDERGRVVPGTFGAAPPADRAQARAYGLFAEAVRQAVPTWRFTPGTAGGCPVRQRLVGTVTFTIGRPPGNHRGGAPPA